MSKGVFVMEEKDQKQVPSPLFIEESETETHKKQIEYDKNNAPMLIDETDEDINSSYINSSAEIILDDEEQEVDLVAPAEDFDAFSVAPIVDPDIEGDDRGYFDSSDVHELITIDENIEEPLENLSEEREGTFLLIDEDEKEESVHLGLKGTIQNTDNSDESMLFISEDEDFMEQLDLDQENELQIDSPEVMFTQDDKEQQEPFAQFVRPTKESPYKGTIIRHSIFAAVIMSLLFAICFCTQNTQIFGFKFLLAKDGNMAESMETLELTELKGGFPKNALVIIKDVDPYTLGENDIVAVNVKEEKEYTVARIVDVKGKIDKKQGPWFYTKKDLAQKAYEPVLAQSIVGKKVYHTTFLSKPLVFIKEHKTIVLIGTFALLLLVFAGSLLRIYIYENHILRRKDKMIRF